MQDLIDLLNDNRNIRVIKRGEEYHVDTGPHNGVGATLEEAAADLKAQVHA